MHISLHFSNFEFFAPVKPITFIFFCIFFDIVKYLSKKHNVKTKLLTQESNLINLKKNI